MSEQNENVAVVCLSGRIDSGNAAEREAEIREELKGKEALPLVLDAEKLEYISSAGLRILLRLKKAWRELRMINVSSEVYEILEMTGFTEMLEVEKAYKRISVEGCEVIGEGANGKVYRIDEDTVVKTYKNADALEEIRHEREVARLALILGVPTAISYDVVRVGDHYGSVFELLSARSFAAILKDEPEKMDWCVREYVEMLKKIHETEVPAGKLPSIKEAALSWVSRRTDLLPGGKGEKLLSLVREIPEQDTMIHGDYHLKNIVQTGDEVLLIDMDTLSVGHPIFELAQMYCTYVGFSEVDRENVLRFMGFDFETSKAFWEKSLGAYLGTEEEEKIREAENKVRCIAYARLIDWSLRHKNPGDEMDQAARKHWLSELTELLDQVDTLSLAAAG